MIEWRSADFDGSGDTACRPQVIAKRPDPGGSAATSVPRCVLIVDDDDPVRETLAELLEDEGYHPVQACNATDAMAVLQMQPVDVLVTDLSMPGDDGIALIRQAKLTRPELPAILLTGYAEAPAAVSMIAGMQCHVL